MPERNAPAPEASTLIIGYGNVSRRDDGVALHILRRLRARLGLPPDDLIEPGESAGAALAMVCVHQLVPELAETLISYDTVVFVDAHVKGAGWDPLHWQEVEPAYRSGMVSHHLKPAALLALNRSLYGRSPTGYLLSVLGHDFDFGEELSPETNELAEQAVERLLGFLER